MASAIDHLLRLQEHIKERDEGEEELTFFEQDGQFHVKYYGLAWELVTPVLDTICQPEVAVSLASLSFGGPDGGAKGTPLWDFSPIFLRDITFPVLRRLTIELNKPEDYNRSVMQWIWDEGGQLARWLDRAPNLEELTAPSAPAAAFFLRPPHPLRHLQIDAGWDTEDFIDNLSHSTCFPRLEELDWGDYHETYRDDWKQHVTPFYFYKKLFQSPPLPSSVTLRKVIFDDAEEALLRKLFEERYPRGTLKIDRYCT
jgi:hypothetical protein